MSDASYPTGSAATAHSVNELLPAPKLVTLGFQHVLVMYASAIAVPLIVGRALQLSPEEVAFLISADTRVRSAFGASTSACAPQLKTQLVISSRLASSKLTSDLSPLPRNSLTCWLGCQRRSEATLAAQPSSRILIRCGLPFASAARQTPKLSPR